jgi:hypothetical protein
VGKSVKARPEYSGVSKKVQTRYQMALPVRQIRFKVYTPAASLDLYLIVKKLLNGLGAVVLAAHLFSQNIVKVLIRHS